MSKLLAILEQELNDLKGVLLDESERRKAAEERIQSDADIVSRCNERIDMVKNSINSTLSKVEALKEDSEAAKVAAEGFLKGLRDDKTKLSEDSKLNFAGLCEALGIEIEIEEDENTQVDEETEEGGEILQTGT